MKRFATLLLAMGLASAAFAEGLPKVEDADGNGTWSMAELQTVWADLTDEGFAAVDANGDAAVDAAELQAALDNGVLKPVEG